MPSNFLRGENDEVRIYTHLTIMPLDTVNLKRLLSSIKRNLPKGWKNLYTSQYQDTDTFKLVTESVCLLTPKFQDVVTKIIYFGKIWLGLTGDQIQVLKIDIEVENMTVKDILIYGQVMYLLYTEVLKPSKYFDKFFFEFRYGGNEDAHWIIDDIREKRPIRIYETLKERWFVLSQNEKVKIKDIEVQIKPPNNIALCLSSAKKSVKEALGLIKKIKQEMLVDNELAELEDTKILFDYFEQIQSAIIFSYTAVEAFANSAIPNNFTFEKNNEKGIKEIWSKENIERWMSTSDKISEILPGILKSGDVKQQIFWSDFKKLEKIRNGLIHQRSVLESDDPASLNNLIDESIFNTIESAIKLINFYYNFQESHPYFPLGIGIAKYNTIEVEDFGKHFKVLKN